MSVSTVCTMRDRFSSCELLTYHSIICPLIQTISCNWKTISKRSLFGFWQKKDWGGWTKPKRPKRLPRIIGEMLNCVSIQFEQVINHSNLMMWGVNKSNLEVNRIRVFPVANSEYQTSTSTNVVKLNRKCQQHNGVSSLQADTLDCNKQRSPELNMIQKCGLFSSQEKSFEGRPGRDVPTFSLLPVIPLSRDVTF